MEMLDSLLSSTVPRSLRRRPPLRRKELLPVNVPTLSYNLAKGNPIFCHLPCSRVQETEFYSPKSGYGLVYRLKQQRPVHLLRTSDASELYTTLLSLISNAPSSDEG